MLSKDKR